MSEEAFQELVSIDLGGATLEFNVLKADGSCGIQITSEDGSLATGNLTNYERRRLIGALRGDYTVWFGSGDAFSAALEAFYKDGDLDTFGDGRDGFRRSMAAAIAAYNLAHSGAP